MKDFLNAIGEVLAAASIFILLWAALCAAHIFGG